MKKFIVYLPLAILFIIGITLSFAQQSQNTQKPNSEIEALKNRISELESKLQTVENIEKMELAAKLADANAKLVNAEFGKFERELRDSNNRWLWTWTAFFVGILAVVGVALWFSVKSLIADRVEKNLNGFKEAVVQLDEIKNQLKVLEKEHAASVLENIDHFLLQYDPSYRKQTDVISEEALLKVFSDEGRRLQLRYKAAVVLADRKFEPLVFLLLEFLNSTVNSERSMEVKSNARDFVYLVGEINTQEAYEGLKKFLNRLLTENPKCKDWFLTYTAFSLADISIELEMADSVSVLKKVLPDLEDTQRESKALTRLVVYFDMFNEPNPIKEILTKHVTNKMPGLEARCLKFLENHDPQFVKQWQAEKETPNTKNEEPS
ncbi:MAG: hypothetical protein OXL96_13220 [Candidatus Poribacteria bacterium]|nr:hypothetical protein [Candidatus Poribacteria bacterium]